MRGLSLVAASGGHSSSRCVGLSLSRPLLLRSTGSRRTGSVVVAHGPSCSAACGIFPEQGSNPCPLHWQADSQPLCHQGSATNIYYLKFLWASSSGTAELGCVTQSLMMLQLRLELQSSEGLPRVGGSASKMAHSRGCWQEASVPCWLFLSVWVSPQICRCVLLA